MAETAIGGIVLQEKKNEVAEEPAPPGFFGIAYEDWGRILGCLFTLYVFLALFYASLITVAVEIRGGENYKSLPDEYFGPYDRDWYFQGLGARRNNMETIYPWIKASVCPNNAAWDVCVNCLADTPQGKVAPQTNQVCDLPEKCLADLQAGKLGFGYAGAETPCYNP